MRTALTTSLLHFVLVPQLPDWLVASQISRAQSASAELDFQRDRQAECTT